MQPLSLATYEVPLLVVNRLLPLVSHMIAATLADLQYVDKIKGTYPVVWECIVQ